MNKESKAYVTSLLQKNITKREQLERLVLEYIHHDQHRLYNLLYRLDVDEQDLSKALKHSTQPSEAVITNKIIARCNQIITTRKKYAKQQSTTNHEQ